ncbi:MAG: FAD-binding protein [Atopobiaceae bacterium]|nr:FAD-binding protein [Atopobiaceae bacterium]
MATSTDTLPVSTDILIIGAGPAGIFCALSLLKRGDDRHITIVEKGLPVDRRSCPKDKVGYCVGCKPCRITTGFSGAGAFSDGKLSLSYEVGGDLPELIGADLAQRAIKECDDIYLSFGADPHVEGVERPEEVAKIRRRAIKAGLKLVDCPIRHLGTERAQQLYSRIQQHLLDAGVSILFEHECLDLVVEEGAGISSCTGAVVKSMKGSATPQVVRAQEVIVATGRRGASWLADACEAHGISHEPGPMDMGVRVEVRNEVMEDVNNVLYESKLVGYPNPFRDKVRTFCQNPGGFVSQENYDGGLAVVNGHSYKERKSNNTNLAVLCTQHFQEPFDRPIAYAQRVGKLMNMLGAGHILVQRFGDVLDGKRTWRKELSRSNVVPTLPDAEPGDITSAMPYRAMTDIVEFIKAVDYVVPGFAASETLLYAPELKFYSNRVRMDERFETSVVHLHCLGDSSGWTRGLMMASVMGWLMGKWL